MILKSSPISSPQYFIPAIFCEDNFDLEDIAVPHRLNIRNMISASGQKSSLSMYVVIGLTAIICTTIVKAELQQVNVLFRHGDRTPDDHENEMYPNDPYLNYSFYPMGRGQLTNQGKRREYALGKFLRDRYNKFLGDTYTPQSVTGVSSYFDRTKMSLQLVLAALFPPNNKQKWNPHLNWQPVPTTYMRSEEDNLFLADGCPLYLAEYDRVLASLQGKTALSKYANFMQQLSVWTGKNVTTAWDMFYMYHTLMAEYSFGLTLPDWAHSVFPYGELWNGTVLAYDIASSTPLLRRIYGGSYLRRVTESMLQFINGSQTDERKMHLYSGHETNIAAVLHSLKLYYPHVPEYSSSILLELHKVDNEYYIKILYYLGIPPKANELQLPDCDVLCPLTKYLQITKDMIPTREELSCNKNATQQYSDEKSPEEIDLVKYNLIRTAKVPKLNDQDISI